MAEITVEADPGPLTLRSGLKVDAINNPNTMTVYLDDVSWAQRELRIRYQIVIHELLGLMRVPDLQYSYSAKLASLTSGAMSDKISLKSGLYEYSKRNGFPPADIVVSAEGIVVFGELFKPTKKANVYEASYRRITVLNTTSFLYSEGSEGQMFKRVAP